MSTLRERIRMLRIENNLTQEEFGKLFGIVKSTVSLYESGKSTPDIQTQKKICEYFNISLDWLHGRTNIRNEKTIQNIKNAIDDNPELMELWNRLVQREDLQFMFEQTKRLTPESIRKIIEVIKLIEDEENPE
ncbi:MAG: helix-turn-helix transcriptional regulator [Firmicutes bacterium]|nr:helix-turn-helix transcriptional regulator [Bacillota bacterium]